MSVKLPDHESDAVIYRLQRGATEKDTEWSLSREGPQAPAWSHQVSELNSWRRKVGRRKVGVPPGHGEQQEGNPSRAC